MKKSKLLLLATSVALLSTQAAQAQNSENYGYGLKMNLSPAGDKYIRFLLWNQMWGRSIDNNPGTMVNNVAAKNTLDFAARSMRLLVCAQISPRYMIVTHFGVDNQTFDNGGAPGTTGTGAAGSGKKPQLFIHDAYNEYAVIPAVNPKTQKNNKFTLYLGGGLHYWNGISRMSSASTVNMLMVDAPIFNWPTIENSDQFGRQFGIYIKGVAKKFHYQFSVDKPFATGVAVKDSANVAVDNNGLAAAAFNGYVDYQFLEQESNVLPYRTGTYIGAKKVFNIGGGFYHEANGTLSSSATGVTQKHDINLFGADAFLDMPFGDKARNMAITAYGVYYNFNFGPNYLRTSGTMNVGASNPAVAAADKVLEGPGNARVLLGTGSIAYIQTGLLLPKFKGNKIRLQPIAAYSYKNFDALKAAGSFWDAGCNMYLDAHNAKITAQYSSRPLYDETTKELKDRKGEVIVQLQVML